jgi:hypothetical protein
MWNISWENAGSGVSRIAANAKNLMGFMREWTVLIEKGLADLKSQFSIL